MLGDEAQATELQPMDRPFLTDQLARHAMVFHGLLHGLPADQYRWRPEAGKWCALEIICHLYDEEREDFRARLRHVLDTPDRPMQKIDPTAWVAERGYMDQDFNRMLGMFLDERAGSLEWLRTLDDAPWENFYEHPTVGPVSCELLLTNWVAHDLHHIRQLNNLRYAYLNAHTTVPLDYAGTW